MATPFQTEAASQLYFQFAAELLVELYQVVLEATFPYRLGYIEDEGTQRAVQLTRVSRGGLSDLLSLSRQLDYLSPRIKRAILDYGHGHEAIAVTHNLAKKLFLPGT